MARSRVGRGRKRFQARGRGGRFKRNTMENTFGISVDVCPKCGQMHTRERGEPRAEFCKSCGHYGLK